MTRVEKFQSIIILAAVFTGIALAIALVAFPDEPLVPMALVVGPLIELPMLAVISQILLWVGRRRILK